MNWTVSNIWEVRGKNVRDRGGNILPVRLWSDGWQVGTFEGMDIWQALAVLNNRECVPAD